MNTIYINGNLEIVDSLRDISRIIEKHYNRELAQLLDILSEEESYCRQRVEELEDILQDIRMLVG